MKKLFLYMEIALLNEKSLRIKGKQGSVIINPSGKATDANGFILLEDQIDEKISQDTLIISGPGEYEFSGIKISGIRLGASVAYGIRVDRIEILVGRGDIIAKDYSKLHEYHIAVLRLDEAIDPGFVTSIASNVIVFYGAKANDSMKQLANDIYKTESKYSVSFDKLPQEIEKIVLQ